MLWGLKHFNHEEMFSLLFSTWTLYEVIVLKSLIEIAEVYFFLALQNKQIINSNFLNCSCLQESTTGFPIHLLLFFPRCSAYTLILYVQSYPMWFSLSVSLFVCFLYLEVTWVGRPLILTYADDATQRERPALVLNCSEKCTDCCATFQCRPTWPWTSAWNKVWMMPLGTALVWIVSVSSRSSPAVKKMEFGNSKTLVVFSGQFTKHAADENINRDRDAGRENQNEKGWGKSVCVFLLQQVTTSTSALKE